MTRAPSRKHLTKRLDIAWAKLAKVKRPYCERCERCPPAVILDTDHIVSRMNRRLRHDVRNACVLCRRCHLYWKHREPLEFADWIRAHRPEDVAYLERTRNEISHFSVPDLQDMLADLESSLARELEAA